MKILPAQAQKLKQRIESLPDKRKARGLRHRQSTILQIAICALLSGARSYIAIADWAKNCSQNVLKRLGGRFDRGTGRYVPPSEPTIRRVCQAAELEPTEEAFNGWLNELALTEQPTEEAIAVDGKVLKGSRDEQGKQSHLLSACLHQSGVTIAQRKVCTKSNEIPELRTLLEPLPIAGRVVTADALHTQHDTANYLVEHKKAHYLLIAKGNQPTLRDDIALLNLHRTAPQHETFDKEHGRFEERAIWTSTALNEYLEFPHVGQVFCIRRRVTEIKKQVSRQELVYGLTDLPPDQATPQRVLELNRGHWGIENRSHYVRDVTFDEDRSQVRTANGPQLMACLRNFTIGVLRVVNKATNIASELRKLASKPHLSLQLLGL